MRNSATVLLFLLFPAFILFTTPLRAASLPGDTTQLPCLEKAGKLLDEAIGFMQKNYYKKDWVDWNSLKDRAKSMLNASNNCDDAYAAITWCFRQLDEQHSFLMPPDKAALYTNDENLLSRTPSLAELVGEMKGEWLQDSIAYITIPWVSTTDSLVCEQIADSLQAMIRRLDSKGVSKWIIDLRKNTGGNCWPMLAGIGPLLGDGICGYFVSTHSKIPISYQDGAALQGRHVRCRVSTNAYHTKHIHNSIVVLTGHKTVSAGEIVALAFKGKEQTYLYGEPTAGLTTANATYSLSDHSMLILTVCQEADHTGRICDGRILPDKYVSSETRELAQQDPVKTAAINWLQSQQALP